MSDLLSKAEALAARPKSMSVDGTSVTNQDISQVIEADRYVKSERAAKKKRGFTFLKIVPPGTV